MKEAFKPVRVAAFPLVSKTFSPAKATVEVLPKEVQDLVPKLMLELTSGKSVVDFGEGTTANVAKFADDMLNHVSMTNIGEFQKPLTEILVLCTSVNAKSISSGSLNSRMPFVQRAKLWFSNTKTRVISNINSVKDQIDSISKELVKREDGLRKNINTLEDMYKHNMQEYYVTMAHIKAIENVVSTKTEELKIFKLNNQGSSDPLVALEVNTRQSFLTSLDRKLYDLRATSLACVATAPMILSEQESSERSIEKFRSVRSMAIPQWKKQAVMMISSMENQAAAALGNQVDNTTNQMFKDNVAAVAKNSIDTAKLGERGVLDMETLEFATKVLVDTANETLAIAETGRKSREDAASRIVELKQTLNLNVINRGV